MVTNSNTTPVKAQAAPSASPKTTGMVSGNTSAKAQTPKNTQVSAPATNEETTTKQSAPAAAKTAAPAPAKEADSKPATPAPQAQPTKTVTDNTTVAKPKTMITTRKAAQDNVATPKAAESAPVVEQSAPVASEQATAPATDVVAPVSDATVAETSVAPAGTPARTQNTGLAANTNGGSTINTDDYAAKNVQVIAAQGSQLMAAKENRERMAKLQLDTTATAKPMHITINYTNNGKTISSVSETVQGGQTLDIQGHMPSGYQVSGMLSINGVKDGGTVDVPVVPISSSSQTIHYTINYLYNDKTVGTYNGTLTNGEKVDITSHVPSGYRMADIWVANGGIKDGDVINLPVVPTNSSNTNNSNTSNSGSSTTDNSGNTSSNTTPSNGSSSNNSGNSSNGSSNGSSDNSSSNSSQNNSGSSDSSQNSSDNSQSGSTDNSENSSNRSQNTTPSNGSSSDNSSSSSSTNESDIPLTINWVDQTTGKTIGSTKVNLKPGSTNDITSLCPKGYRIDGSWNQQNITKDTKTANVPVVPVTNSNSSSSSDQNTDSNKKDINIDVNADAGAKAKGKANVNVNVNADDKARGQGVAAGSCGLGSTANCDMGDAVSSEGMGAVEEEAPVAAAAPQYAEVPETVEVPAEGQGDVAMPATGQKHGSVLADLAAAAVTLIGGSALLKRRNG